MADDQRVYSDEEFAVILRTAAELSGRVEQPGVASSGLTLAEMKSAAAQAGLDPALVERAASMLVPRTPATPFEKLLGGPLRHERERRFAVKLDEENAARLLSVIRVSAAHFHSANAGHSSAQGMTWQASGEGDVVSVAARPDENGTTASIVIDRRGTFILTGLVSGMAMLMSLLAGLGFYGEIGSYSFLFPVVGIGATLGMVRGFWASSTRKARERIDSFMDAIARSLAQPPR
jgi:hypothetical protein